MVRTDAHAAHLRERADLLDERARHTPGTLAERLRGTAGKLRGYADTHDTTRITVTPNTTDTGTDTDSNARGKTGSKVHVLSDRAGLPLSVAVSAANTNDAVALKPLVMAIPAIKSRRGPRRRKPAKLHADKAYDQAELCRWVRQQGIGVRIARKGIESS